MKLKFEKGEKVLFNNQEVTIKVARKNFSTGEIMYRLDNNTEVKESDLKKIKSKVSQKTEAEKKLEQAHQEYEDLFKKAVPLAKKNKLEWIQGKINEERTVQRGKGGDSKSDKSPFELLKDVLVESGREGLSKIIDEKNLDIDPKDYEDDSELLISVAEELGIELPEQEGAVGDDDPEKTSQD